MILGVWDSADVNIGEAFLIALVAILIVVATLIVVILIVGAFQKGIRVVEAKTNILPREENKILESDEDAVVAVLTATIDFYKETGKEPRVVSVSRLEE